MQYGLSALPRGCCYRLGAAVAAGHCGMLVIQNDCRRVFQQVCSCCSKRIAVPVGDMTWATDHSGLAVAVAAAGGEGGLRQPVDPAAVVLVLAVDLPLGLVPIRLWRRR